MVGKTKEHLATMVEDLNSRMESRESSVRYEVSYRSDYPTINRVDGDGVVRAHVMSGTKKEIEDYLHVMMVALDDAAL